jgi:hypothetical protein
MDALEGRPRCAGAGHGTAVEASRTPGCCERSRYSTIYTKVELKATS